MKYLIDFYRADYKNHTEPAKSIYVTCSLADLMTEVAKHKEARREGICCWEAWDNEGKGTIAGFSPCKPESK